MEYKRANKIYGTLHKKLMNFIVDATKPENYRREHDNEYP